MKKVQAFAADFAAGMRSWSGDALDALSLYTALDAFPAGLDDRGYAAQAGQAGASDSTLRKSASRQNSAEFGAEPTAALQQGVQLDLQQVSKQFGHRKVLQPLDLHVTPGEFVAIVGRSGCGKSTLLRLVAGLELPSSGQVQLNQTPIHGMSEQTRIMFQEARLLPWKTVWDNVALGLPQAHRQHALQVLAQVGLADRAHEWPANLSGGQRQRVALARALVHQPQLLLLDEPLGALDALTRIEMHGLIESLWRTLGFTALLVTHDVQEAVALADRVLLIEDGAIALDLRIDLPHPRERGSAAFADLEKRLLDRVLATGTPHEHVAAVHFPTPERWQWAI